MLAELDSLVSSLVRGEPPLEEGRVSGESVVGSGVDQNVSTSAVGSLLETEGLVIIWCVIITSCVF